ncbi:MAG: hypothetical protein R2911_19030 [Caldilineaceae bacterium]
MTSDSDRQNRSQLFTVRLWIEPGVPRPGVCLQGELRFKVQHVSWRSTLLL